jgi:hypothetical protein
LAVIVAMSPVPLDDDEMPVFRIALDDPQKLQRNWPPTSFRIFMFAVSLFLYPVWVVVCSAYRNESDRVPAPLSFILDGISAWILDYVPTVVANILVLHLVGCVLIWFWN